MLLSDVRTHPSFRFIPEREDSFDQVCALFDEIDQWLRTGPVAHGMFWAESGLDVPFNEEHLASFRETMGRSWDAFEKFLFARSHAVDRATNMEW